MCHIRQGISTVMVDSNKSHDLELALDARPQQRVCLVVRKRLSLTKLMQQVRRMQRIPEVFARVSAHWH